MQKDKKDIKQYTMKKLLTLVAIIVAATQVKAQNEPVVAHFAYHTNVFNPAVAGNVKDIYLSALYRQQWVGFKQAPSTFLFDGYAYIAKARGGVGLVVSNDMLGKQRFTTAKVSYAYSQRLNDRCRLSIGLGIGLFNSYVKGEELIYQDHYTVDQSAILTNTNKFKAFLSGGIEFSGYNTTIGFSVSNLDQGLKSATPFKVPRHYFGYVKYSWDINKKFNLTPSVFIRSIDFIAQAEVNVALTWNKRIIVGLLYRSNDAVGAMLGVHITKGLTLSYAYDFNCGKLSPFQTGSHEVQLIYRIPGPKEKKVFLNSPRYLD
jgi:type IX secretion system PorP/SprF family membrane protein